LPPDKPVIASAVLPVDEQAQPDALAGRNAAISRLNAAIAKLCLARCHQRREFVSKPPV
jgi:hypothetical protein